MTRTATKPRKPADRRKKLSVYVDPSVLRRIGVEKYESGLTIEEIVNRRLDLSYEVNPGPLAEPQPANS